jgi:hypothetical protein
MGTLGHTGHYGAHWGTLWAHPHTSPMGAVLARGWPNATPSAVAKSASLFSGRLLTERDHGPLADYAVGPRAAVEWIYIKLHMIRRMIHMIRRLT